MPSIRARAFDLYPQRTAIGDTLPHRAYRAALRPNGASLSLPFLPPPEVGQIEFGAS